MQKDERLLPLPNGVGAAASNLQTTQQQQDYPANYSPVYDDDSIEQPRSIVEYLNIVYKRLPIILAMTIITTAVVAFYMYRQPSMYEARTEMVIEPPKPKSSQTTYINLNSDPNYYNTQLQLLQSPELMRQVVIRLGLQRDPNLFAGQNRSFFSTLRTMVSGEKDAQNKESSLPVITTATSDASIAEQSNEIVLTPEEKARADAYAGMLLGGLHVQQVEKTNIVNVSMQLANPELAAKVADKTAELFIEQDVSRATQGSKKNLEDLNDSIGTLKNTIDQQARDLIAEQTRSNLPLTGDEGDKFNSSRLQTVSDQLLKAKDERSKLEADYAAAVRANDNGEIFSVLGNNQAIQEMRKSIETNKNKLAERVQELGKQIDDLQAKKSQLLARYTPEYKDVVAITEEINKRQEILDKIKAESASASVQDEKTVKQQVAKEVLTGMRAQLDAAQKREAQFQSAYNQELASANQKGIAGTRLTTLIREIQTNRTLLDTYIQRQKELELTVSGSRPDNLTISNHAVKPDAPFGPNRNRNILIALMMSLSAGIGLAFLLDYLDDSVRTSDDIGRYLGLPTLAMIPHQSTVEKRKLSSIGNGAGSSALALVSLEDNRSAIAEAYRHLRTSLLFSSAGKPPQTILVTSSQPSEGKTTTAINTAITLAQAGADVVIIDCDLRRPRLHSHFGMENGTGITNYLSGEKNTDGLLKPYPSLPKLKVITSGPIPPNPAELLSSNEMKNLLQFLKGNYKHVIVDSPPAISFTDAAILSTLVDGVILVAMAGKSSLHLIRRFKQRLATIGARIYGVVLNGVRFNSVEYNYYGYGYTANYYTDYDDETTPRMEQTSAVEEAKN